MYRSNTDKKITNGKDIFDFKMTDTPLMIESRKTSVPGLVIGHFDLVGHKLLKYWRNEEIHECEWTSYENDSSKSNHQENFTEYLYRAKFSKILVTDSSEAQSLGLGWPFKGRCLTSRIRVGIYGP